jgi:4a-hydroxytetrahydrobiopterin dehydratase
MKPLSEDKINQVLSGKLTAWKFRNDKIHRRYSFGNFREAVAFIVRVGFIAEDQMHHPELFNVYNSVKISLCTHDAGDKVTEKDIKLAEAIEEIYKKN